MGMIILDAIHDPKTYFWGATTSTIDWCEENYLVSKFIAEFWNCLTNGMFVVLAVLGMSSAIRYRHGKRVAAFYMAHMLVGIGSAFFHATLKYTTQLLDELPMLYCCAFALYSLIEVDRKLKYGIKLPLALIAFQTAITLTYLFWLQSPEFHQVAFAGTALGSVFFARRRVREMPRISDHTRRLFTRLHLLGHVGMWGGFFVWNLDNIFCHQLRTYRSHVGAPWDAFLQLHGWWHILTAYGSCHLLLFVHFIRLARLGHDHLFTVKYRLGFLPHVTMVEPKRAD
ncbi:alkaline ceramidase ydc1 [Coemansia sp. Benny D115]|nr:alkaline ceramidase ydc1 [Coemansia sp. Benny D115]